MSHLAGNSERLPISIAPLPGSVNHSRASSKIFRFLFISPTRQSTPTLKNPKIFLFLFLFLFL